MWEHVASSTNTISIIFSQVSRFNRKFNEYKYFLAKNHNQVKYQPTIASNKVNIILVQLPSIKCLPASKWECAKDEKDKIFMEKVMWVHLKVFCDFVCHYLFYIFHFHMPIETINSTHMSWTHLLMRAVLSLIFLDRKAKISRKREKNWSMCVRKIIFFFLLIIISILLNKNWNLSNCWTWNLKIRQRKFPFWLNSIFFLSGNDWICWTFSFSFYVTIESFSLNMGEKNRAWILACWKLNGKISFNVHEMERGLEKNSFRDR